MVYSCTVYIVDFPGVGSTADVFIYVHVLIVCIWEVPMQVYETFFLEVVLESHPSRPDSASLCKPYYIYIYYILESICSEISPLSFHKLNICVGLSTLTRLIQL